MANERLRTAAQEFCEAKSESLDIKYTVDDYRKKFHLFDRYGNCVEIIDFVSDFAQSLIDKGDLITANDYKRFRDEYKGEADLSALCCAVADAEEESEKTILALGKDNEQMTELMHFQRSRIKELEKEVQQLRESTLSSAGKEFKSAREILDQGKVFDNDGDEVNSFNAKYGGYCDFNVIGAMEEYANQFKSSPTSTVKVVSDEEMNNAAKLYLHEYAHTIQNGESYQVHLDWVEGAKWMREQLTGRS